MLQGNLLSGMEAGSPCCWEAVELPKLVECCQVSPGLVCLFPCAECLVGGRLEGGCSVSCYLGKWGCSSPTVLPYGGMIP